MTGEVMGNRKSADRGWRGYLFHIYLVLLAIVIVIAATALALR